MKFYIRVLYVMLLGICEVWENWHRDGHTLHMAVNEIIFMCNMQLYDIWKVNNVLVRMYALLWSMQFADLYLNKGLYKTCSVFFCRRCILYIRH
jgi:hypothetical protein